MRNFKEGENDLRQGKLERYKFIEKESGLFPIKLLCRVMKVVRSCYYAYAGRKTFRQNGDAARIKECFDLNCRGSRFTPNCGELKNWTRRGAKGDAA